MRSFLFVARHTLAWAALWLVFIIFWASLVGRGRAWMFIVAVAATLAVVSVRSFSHLRRVRLITDRLDADALGSRHRRRIEIPMAAPEAFDMVEAAVRELPFVEFVHAVKDSLQVRARLRRMDPYLSSKRGPRPMHGAAGAMRNLVTATITPGEGTSSLTLICEPEGGAWVDWFYVDYATNLENAEAVTRAITRRIGEHRKGEEATARLNQTEKELTVAKLSLLHAQVEPHFLYNTLASAQLLTRSDPARADQMLGNLISYLRHSLPRSGDEPSTLGEEVERARAYLEIMKIRMGERLRVAIEVPGALEAVAMPAMMLQTLVENAIKHGLEPLPGGGNLWILARELDGRVAVTVADDGRGFSEDGAGTGVGLKNVRERLRLSYGEAASFSIGANFPKGVAATITLPGKGEA